MLWRFFHIRLADMNSFLTLANCLLPLYVLKVTDVVNHRRTTALKGLPLFLREDPNKLFKKCKVSSKYFKRLTVFRFDYFCSLGLFKKSKYLLVLVLCLSVCKC